MNHWLPVRILVATSLLAGILPVQMVNAAQAGGSKTGPPVQ